MMNTRGTEQSRGEIAIVEERTMKIMLTGLGTDCRHIATGAGAAVHLHHQQTAIVITAEHTLEIDGNELMMTMKDQGAEIGKELARKTVRGTTRGSRRKRNELGRSLPVQLEAIRELDQRRIVGMEGMFAGKGMIVPKDIHYLHHQAQGPTVPTKTLRTPIPWRR